MRYVYPAFFTQTPEGYAVRFPDLDGCFTCGESLEEAMEMARDALELWLNEHEINGAAIPAPSNLPITSPPEFATLILANTEEYRRAMDDVKTVKLA